MKRTEHKHINTYPLKLISFLMVVSDNSVLLYFHIYRLYDKMPERFCSELRKILENIDSLIRNYIIVSKHQGLIQPAMEAIYVQQCIHQAAWDDKPLLQLPHFDYDRAFICKEDFGVRTPADFIRVNKGIQKEIVERLELTEDQLNDIMEVERKVFSVVPILSYSFAEASFKCSSKVTLTVSVTVDKIGNIKEHVKKEGEDIFEKRPDDPVSDDEDEDESSSSSSSEDDDNGTLLYAMLEMIKEHKKEMIRERVKKLNRFSRQYPISEFPEEREFAHTPYMPKEIQDGWWFVLGDFGTNVLAGIYHGVIPANPKEKPLEFELSFVAPETPGIYDLTLYALSDSYIGRDVKITVPIDIIS